MSTITLLRIALAGVIMLLLLVIKAKVQPFVALLLVSLLVALAAAYRRAKWVAMIAGMGGAWFRHYYYWSGRYAGAYDRTLCGAESLATIISVAS